MNNLLAAVCLAACTAIAAPPALADSKVELDAKVQEARTELARHTSAGAELAAKARSRLAARPSVTTTSLRLRSACSSARRHAAKSSSS